MEYRDILYEKCDGVATVTIALYHQTAEAHQGVDAFLEKRKPDFRRKT